jgi:hypothetical protein
MEEFREGSKSDPTIVQALSLYDGLVWPVQILYKPAELIKATIIRMQDLSCAHWKNPEYFEWKNLSKI